MIGNAQIPAKYREALDKQISVFSKDVLITESQDVPSTNEIPYANPQEWLRIPSIICVFVDMRGSTALSAEERDKTTAAAYQLFTGTAVHMFSAFEASYIDVRGDGAFAIFDKEYPHIALAAAVTFKTFCFEEIIPRIRKLTGENVGNHIGIDQRMVLVRKIGFKRRRDSGDWRNEVWAGRPVNMAAKLASMAGDAEILVSDRYYKSLRDEKALYSCGCEDGDDDFLSTILSGGKGRLWGSVDVSERSEFDFETAYKLKSKWCKTHGAEYCDALVKADS
jgi:class 3 adenylate cyclase